MCAIYQVRTGGAFPFPKAACRCALPVVEGTVEMPLALKAWLPKDAPRPRHCPGKHHRAPGTGVMTWRCGSREQRPPMQAVQAGQTRIPMPNRWLISRVLGAVSPHTPISHPGRIPNEYLAW